jgi:hypothetical protein
MRVILKASTRVTIRLRTRTASKASTGLPFKTARNGLSYRTQIPLIWYIITQPDCIEIRAAESQMPVLFLLLLLLLSTRAIKCTPPRDPPCILTCTRTSADSSMGGAAPLLLLLLFHLNTLSRHLSGQIDSFSPLSIYVRGRSRVRAGTQAMPTLFLNTGI